ncbi:MAG: proline iminopeptidase [Crocinitomicaceae bacterium]|jgi:proline iminopeptidase
MRYLRLISLFALIFTFALPPLAENTKRYIDQFELKTVEINNIDVSYRIVGQSEKIPIILIMGLGASHKIWTDDMVKGLTLQNRSVILFDNRDTGGSSKFNSWGEPLLWWELLKSKYGFEVSAPYSLDDMAEDTVALLDELQIEKAHIVGVSMGGMIAQIVAAKYPEHTKSLVSIMSSTGAKHLPPPSDRALKLLEELAKIEQDEDRNEQIHLTGFYPESMPRQIVAMLKSGDRSGDVSTISTPTLIMHGEDDELIPPIHGEHTAQLIKGSKMVIFAGMAHNIPENVLPSVLYTINEHLAL